MIELLVVIAIISLLVSILLPSLTKAGDLAKMVACQAQLRTIHGGIMFYYEDYGVLPAHNTNWGTIPRPGGGTWGSPQCYYQTFSGMIIPYIGEDPLTWTCPAVPGGEELKPLQSWDASYMLHRNLYYGGNVYHVFGALNQASLYPPYKKIEDMKHSASIGMLFDTRGNPLSSYLAKTSRMYCPICLGSTASIELSLGVRHLEQSNILAVGGNILPPATVEEVGENRDNLWGHE
ncbi:MAG: type II secretion system protein [Phycisphaerae bacterium]|nr:type II secretion system protein [Phycisphaerae bacterium]